LNKPLKYTDPSGWLLADPNLYWNLDKEFTAFVDFSVGNYYGEAGLDPFHRGHGGFGVGSKYYYKNGKYYNSGNEVTWNEVLNNFVLPNCETEVSTGGGGNTWFGMVPVAQTFAFDLDIIVVAGAEMSPIGVGIIYKGKDKGKTFAYSDAGKVFLTYGINLSGGVESYIWYYSGDIQNFSIETFNGNRNEFEVGFATWGTGITWSSMDNFGGRLIGVKGDYSTPSPISIYGITINYSYGETWCY
jgi:hypothetical protein